jgi:hypothetical protein
MLYRKLAMLKSLDLFKPGFMFKALILILNFNKTIRLKEHKPCGTSEIFYPFSSNEE